MTAYVIVLILPIIAWYSRWNLSINLSRIFWILYLVILALIIGLRHDVGADWEPYLTGFDNTLGLSLSEALKTSDPAYALLNWLFGEYGGGIYAVNSVCAIILVYALYRFCRIQPLPLLALISFLSYFVIVVGMGYSRQATAIAFEMLAIVSLVNSRFKSFIFYAILGSLFHKTAIIVFTMLLCSKRVHLSKVLFVVAGTISLVFLLMLNNLQFMYELYVEDQMSSGGAIQRIFLGACFCIIFYLFKRDFKINLIEQRIIVWFCVVTVISICVFPLSSTLADRLFLYTLPMQAIIASQAFNFLHNREARSMAYIFLPAFFFILQISWLVLSTHGNAWLPYQSVFSS